MAIQTFIVTINGEEIPVIFAPPPGASDHEIQRQWAMRDQIIMWLYQETERMK